MKTNLFQELRKKREQVKDLANKALEKSWIKENQYQNLIKKIDNDTLTIGVIGQMKAGKSTFINAFLFGEEVLPSATTPMTAALSIITYGEEKRIEVEFYTLDEWLEMKSNASRNIQDASGDKFLESKIKAAKELVEKASRIGDELNSILGTIKKDDLDNLVNYVGADGKYVAITKSVTIYYPQEWLKGVRVVDTPGFNDPVVSREERTQKFLKEADAVLLLVYAGRAFDATDREILFEKVRKVGIGKVLIGINKYDIQYNQGETIGEITQNVKDEVKKACREQNDETINNMLLDLEPIPFSANMALMAKMPLAKVVGNEASKFYWDNACDDFEISSQKEMLEKSLIRNLENAIKETIEKSKAEILLKKPVNVILQSGTNKLNSIEEELNKNTIEKDTLSEFDENWEEKAKGIQRAEKRINRIIEDGVNDIEDELNKELKKFGRDLEDDVISTYKKMENEIEDANRFTRQGSCERKIGNYDEELKRRLKRKMEDFIESMKNIVISHTDSVMSDIEEILRKFLKDDYEDILDEFKSTIKKLNYEGDDYNDEECNQSEEEKYTFLDGVTAFLVGIASPLILVGEGVKRVVGVWKKELREKIEQYKKELLGIIKSDIINDFEKRKKYYLNSINDEGAKQVLPGIIEIRNEYKGKEEERSKRISELEESISKLTQKQKDISQEIEEMKQNSLGII